jgi:hypothetical protein
MSRRPGAKDWGWSSIGQVLGGWMINMSGDTMCGLQRAQGDEEREFLDLASNPRSMVSFGLASKLVVSCFPVWFSKPVATVW